MSNQQLPCFHCGEQLPKNPPIAQLGDEEKPVCCIGCKAVAELIHESGLDSFYELRQGKTIKPNETLTLSQHSEWTVFDREEVQQDFVTLLDNGHHQASVLVEGVHCAACSWLIRHKISPIKGVFSVELNPSTTRAQIEWDSQQISLSTIFQHIAHLGYKPHPASVSQAEKLRLKEKRKSMLRLGLAGLGMMQVMTFALSLYMGAFQGMDENIRHFFRLVSLFVTTPVLFYSGAPFFQGAMRDLKNHYLGMDVPIALALSLAYTASVWVTFFGGEHVYFDSVVMFIFFLLLGRQFEIMVRHHAGSTSDALVKMLPQSCVKLVDNKRITIGVRELKQGDFIVISQGETIPADGIVEQGEAEVDESLLTGESTPRYRTLGDKLIAGSIVRSNDLIMRVTQSGQETTLSTMAKLLDQAQAQRPQLARKADKLARYFVSFVLSGTVVTALIWYFIQPDQAFTIALAVLVVSCPCALSLATPVTLAAATANMARHGLMVVNSDIIENWQKITTVIFDKTGTLTTGNMHLSQLILNNSNEQEVWKLCASLELRSSHPVAVFFQNQIENSAKLPELLPHLHPGQGISSGAGQSEIRLGSLQFVSKINPQATKAPETLKQGTQLCLATPETILAWFVLESEIREGAQQLIENIRKQGKQVALASGDSREAVEPFAEKIGITQWYAELTAEQKQHTLNKIRKQHGPVAMFGDGVNDAVVLASAEVSIAMSEGADMARSSATAVLIGQTFTPASKAINTINKAQLVIKQNLSWAVIYNLFAFPLAAFGMIEPWMAAIGMSLSSLIVTLNAARLSK